MKFFFYVYTFLLLSTSLSTSASQLQDKIQRIQLDPVLDCSIRKLALDFAQYLLPNINETTLLVSDALRLDIDCNTSVTKNVNYQSSNNLKSSISKIKVTPAAIYYIDPVNGNDNAAGTEINPFKSIDRGLRASRGGPTPAQIVLRQGTYYLNDTITLTSIDSNLSIVAYPNETPVLSGGFNLTNLHWRQIAPGPPPIDGPTDGISVVSDVNGLTPGGNVSGIVQFGGNFDDANSCATACLSTSICGAYTWHDTTCGMWSRGCYFRIDGLYNPQGNFPGHYTGRYTGINATIWGAQVPVDTNFDNLYDSVRNRRLTRAKTPNGNPEILGGWADGANWGLPLSYPPPQNIQISSPSRSDDPFFPTYQLGVGGTCAQFNPAEGFWCSTNPPAGSQYNVPSSVLIPNGLVVTNFTSPQRGLIHALHGELWGGWTFAIANADGMNLSWTYGGFQEARGWSSGASFYIENMLSFLDDADEWFLDVDTNMLYMMVNNSAPSPNMQTSLIPTQLDSLIRIEGTQDDPVLGIVLENLTFSHTSPTFMKPFTMASGGDWSVYRGAAVFIEGGVDATINSCVFDGIGGNAVFLSGYNVNNTISNSKFRWIGDNVIVSLGRVNGMDGTSGDVPSGTKVLSNIASEFGIYVKQSGFYYHALSANATVEGNVVFNMPRAAININDGFAGGHTIKKNLLFNCVRVTSDHGCYNSWDRQPYIWDATNTSRLYPALTTVSENFIINGYHSTWPIDTDDGSNALLATHNFLAYGGSKNYLGLNKIWVENFHLYPDATIPTMKEDYSLERYKYSSSPYCYSSAGTSKLPAYLRDAWVNCTCIASTASAIYNIDCDPSTPQDGVVPVLANNTFLIDSGEYQLQCGSTWDLAQAQANGLDVGSTVSVTPSTMQILSLVNTFTQEWLFSN